MKSGDGFGWLGLLGNSRGRDAVHGLVLLRRTYERVLMMAALEEVRDAPTGFYQGYVDALEIIGHRVARAL